MKVLFIHHSSFYVELEKTALLFDYFDGSRINGYTFSGKIPPLPADKEVYCFASHKHQDHFDMDILKLAKIHPKVHYVLSKDCEPQFFIKTWLRGSCHAADHVCRAGKRI